MDIDFVVDPTPVVNESVAPVMTTLTAPEATATRGDVAPEAIVVDSSAPPIPPEASGEKNIEKSPIVSAAASEEARTSSIPISVDISVESAVVRGLKESLAKASEFELRLRELA